MGTARALQAGNGRRNGMSARNRPVHSVLRRDNAVHLGRPTHSQLVAANTVKLRAKRVEIWAKRGEDHSHYRLHVRRTVSCSGW